MFELSEVQKAAVDAVREFMQREVKPVASKLEHANEYPHDIVAHMKELGFFGFTIPPEYGGLGLDTVTYAAIIDEICQVWMSVSGILNAHLIMAYTVAKNGTEEQKRRFLPKMASGEWRGGVALSEPDAGSDLQAIRTTAVRKGDKYIINGTKMFITNSFHGNTFAVLAKTDPKAVPAHKGISLFIVQKGPGFEVTRQLDKLGYKGIDTCEVVFTDCEVPAENLIGGAEGKGFPMIMSGLELGRINVAARGVGLAQAALTDALRYSQQRVTFGKPICQHQAIQLKLAEMATRVRAARLLVMAAAEMKDRDERCDMEAGMAKLFCTETAMYCAEESMRIHGGYGYTKEFDVERYYRDAPLLVIGEGTNEIQRLIIAKQMIQRNPVA